MPALNSVSPPRKKIEPLNHCDPCLQRSLSAVVLDDCELRYLTALSESSGADSHRSVTSFDLVRMVGSNIDSLICSPLVTICTLYHRYLTDLFSPPCLLDYPPFESLCLRVSHVTTIKGLRPHCGESGEPSFQRTNQIYDGFFIVKR